MTAHGLINSDKFNYVSNISFLKIQDKNTKMSLAVSRVPICRPRARRPSCWKEQSYVSTVLKWDTLMPGNGDHCQPYWEGFNNPREPRWVSSALQTARPPPPQPYTWPCSWDKHTRVSAAAWERHTGWPISAHLEQWWSLEIFFFCLRIRASNRRSPQLPTLRRAWGFARQLEVTFCFTFERKSLPSWPAGPSRHSYPLGIAKTIVSSFRCRWCTLPYHSTAFLSATYFHYMAMWPLGDTGLELLV